MAKSVSNICRICLQQIEEKVQFYFLNNENGLMLQSKLLNFLPEFDLKVTQNPIICKRCTTTIDGIYNFKQLCLRTETIIKDLVKMQQKPFKDVLNYITKDTVHETIKDELVEDTIVEMQQPFENILNYVKKDSVYETFKEELVEDTIIDEPQIVDDDCLQVNTDLPVCIEASTKPLFYCYTCSYHTNSKTNLAQHVHSHKKDTVHETFKEELVEDTIIKDELQVVDDDCLQLNTNLPLCIEAPTKPQFYCYTCNYNTDVKSNLIQHVHTHCSQLHQHNICDYKCSKRYKLTVHMRSDTSNKPYEGKRRFYQLSHTKRSNLTTHMKQHSNVENYKCSECDFSSVFKNNLKRHMNRMHDREKVMERYNCGKCDYSSMLKPNLLNHVIRMHNTEKIAKTYKCSECNYSSEFKPYLNSHMIRMHCRKKKGISYKCDECNYSSMIKQNFKRHVNRMHYREKIAKNYKCGECDYSSMLKENLRRHVTNMHNREHLVKNHKCNVCEYVTNSKTCLVAHIRSHTGEKPYKCNICDYRFTQNSNLKAHLNTHASEQIF